MLNELRGRADLHIHSAVGDGLATIAQILDYVEHRTDLDLIAITDHDEVRGALEARELAASRRRRFEVIVGTEVTTRQGHLLAYGVERRYPMLRSLRDSIAAVHDDGGFVVVPHPLSFLTTSAGRRALCRAVDCDDARRRPDAIELNRRLGLAETGGSDAHHLELIGTAWTSFPGRTAADFRAAVAARATAAGGRFWTLGDHLHGFAEQQWRSMVLAPTQKLVRAIRRP